jgi:hypothetical protein
VEGRRSTVDGERITAEALSRRFLADVPDNARTLALAGP